MTINGGAPQDSKILTGFNNVTTSDQANRTPTGTETKTVEVAKNNIPKQIITDSLPFPNRASFMRTGSILKNIALIFGRIFNTKNYNAELKKYSAEWNHSAPINNGSEMLTRAQQNSLTKFFNTNEFKAITNFKKELNSSTKMGTTSASKEEFLTTVYTFDKENCKLTLKGKFKNYETLIDSLLKQAYALETKQYVSHIATCNSHRLLPKSEYNVTNFFNKDITEKIATNVDVDCLQESHIQFPGEYEALNFEKREETKDFSNKEVKDIAIKFSNKEVKDIAIKKRNENNAEKMKFFQGKVNNSVKDFGLSDNKKNVLLRLILGFTNKAANALFSVDNCQILSANDLYLAGTNHRYIISADEKMGTVSIKIENEFSITDTPKGTNKGTKFGSQQSSMTFQIDTNNIPEDLSEATTEFLAENVVSISEMPTHIFTKN